MQQQSESHSVACSNLATRRRVLWGAVAAAAWHVKGTAAGEAVAAPPTFFEKLQQVCASGQDLVEASRAAAEFELCVVSLQGAATCAQGGRSTSLRQQVQAMHRAALVLRETLPSLAAKALRRGPPSASPADLLLQVLGKEVPDARRWPSAVAQLQGQADAALLQLQVQAWVLMTEPELARDPDRLLTFAASIKEAREQYRRLGMWAGA